MPSVANPSLCPKSLIHRENTGSSPETGFRGGARFPKSGPFSGSSRRVSLNSETGKFLPTSRESRDTNRLNVRRLRVSRWGRPKTSEEKTQAISTRTNIENGQRVDSDYFGATVSNVALPTPLAKDGQALNSPPPRPDSLDRIMGGLNRSMQHLLFRLIARRGKVLQLLRQARQCRLDQSDRALMRCRRSLGCHT